MSFGDLPHVESAACDCPVINDERNESSKKDESDRRLVNWEKWMRNRGDMNEKLSGSTSRKKDELLMNSFEDRRSDIEQKMMLEYAKFPHLHHRYSGNPAFWKLPTRLAQFCGETQHYEAVIPKMELCEMPDVEYVKVPDYIKKEKTAEYREQNRFWRKSPYLNVRYKGDPEMKLIEPFKPNLQSLCVLGKQVIEDVNTTITDDTNQTPQQKIKSGIQNYCVLILNDSWVMSDASGEHVMTIYINSSSYTELTTAHLQIKNQSTKCLRFHFIPHTIKRIFEKPKDPCIMQKLFFNKKQQLLQPGETQNFPFWYRSKYSGPYSESFQMRIIPDLWENRLKIVLDIRAHTGTKDFLDRSYELLNILEERARARIIKEVFQDIIKKIPQKRSDIVVYSYDKATIFEAANSVYDPIHLRPKYLYDKTVVDQLEDFFARIRLEEHPQSWDYKLDNLRIIVKDRLNYDEAQLLEEDIKKVADKLEECKTKHEKFEESLGALWAAKDTKKKGGKEKKQKPPKPQKDKKDKGKKEKGPTVMKEPERAPLPYTLMDELEDIIKKLKSPSSFILEHTKRLRLCYNLLCAYIDRIFDGVEAMEKSLNIARLHPKERKQDIAGTERIYNEVMDPTHMQFKRFKDIPPLIAETKAPEWTLTIPLDDHLKRYNAFHGIDDKSSKAKGKDKGKGKATSSKSKSKSAKSVIKSESTNLTHDTILEDSEVVSSHDDEVYISVKNSELYENNFYLIVYTNLQMCIDDLVAIFEMETRPELPQNVLNFMINDQEGTLEPISSLQVRVYDLRKVISQTLCSTIDVESPLKLVPPEKINLTDKSMSVWNLLNPYMGRKQHVSQRVEGEVYGVRTKAFAPEVCEGFTAITPPEIILERNLQTSLCGSDTVMFSSQELEEDPADCVCHQKRDAVDMNLPYHDSVGGFDKLVSITSSSEITSCKK